MGLPYLRTLMDRVGQIAEKLLHKRVKSDELMLLPVNHEL